MVYSQPEILDPRGQQQQQGLGYSLGNWHEGELGRDHLLHPKGSEEFV